jgi:3-phosphoshikimate 1-carboxyvinyltransferase
VFCRDGATTSRFLPALAAAGHGEFHFDASSQMRRRPLGPLTTALRSLGVDLVHEIEEGHHPLTIRADGIKGGHITLDAGLSSQFLTALLLLGPLTAEGLAITVTDLVSAPYVEITTAMMERFGVGVERDGDTVNMRDISDTMPTLAAIAPVADGPVRIEDVYNARCRQ